MRPFAFMDTRVRGFRIVELGGLAVLLVLVLTVYLAKAGAGGKRADIDNIQQQIFDEQTQIRVLKAEVATLEQPERIETLSNKYLGLEPLPAKREITPQSLVDVSRVMVVGQKAVLVAGSDPLTAVGSPDVTPSQATRPGAATTTTVPATTAPATPQDATSPAAAPAAAAPTVAMAIHPVKLAKADAPPAAAAHPAAKPAHAAHPAASTDSIDDLLTDAPASRSGR